jgi:hypothetical protein
LARSDDVRVALAFGCNGLHLPSPRAMSCAMTVASAPVVASTFAYATGPCSINAYLVEVQDFTAAASGGEGKKFKIDPQRLLYSLQ